MGRDSACATESVRAHGVNRGHVVLSSGRLSKWKSASARRHLAKGWSLNLLSRFPDSNIEGAWPLIL